MRVGRVLTCECGFDARAADEEGLVAAVRRHAAEAHCMPLSHDEALLLAVRDETKPSRRPIRKAAHDPSQGMFKREEKA